MKIFGSIIRAIGFLIAGTSGVCLLSALGIGNRSSSSAEAGIAAAGDVIFIGVPFLFGVVLVVMGWAIVDVADYRERRRIAERFVEYEDAWCEESVVKTDIKTPVQTQSEVPIDPTTETPS